jgi:hypothetical protein
VLKRPVNPITNPNPVCGHVRSYPMLFCTSACRIAHLRLFENFQLYLPLVHIIHLKLTDILRLKFPPIQTVKGHGFLFLQNPQKVWLRLVFQTNFSICYKRYFAFKNQHLKNKPTTTQHSRDCDRFSRGKYL